MFRRLSLLLSQLMEAIITAPDSLWLATTLGPQSHRNTQFTSFRAFHSEKVRISVPSIKNQGGVYRKNIMPPTWSQLSPIRTSILPTFVGEGGSQNIKSLRNDFSLKFHWNSNGSSTYIPAVHVHNLHTPKSLPASTNWNHSWDMWIFAVSLLAEPHHYNMINTGLMACNVCFLRLESDHQPDSIL